MADSKELRKPRRKKRRFMRLEYPFPVPEQKSVEDNTWYYYQGFLRSNCVVVENIGDLTFLYKMGFFGKGILSRSQPEYEKISNISQIAFSNSDRLRRLPPRERQIRQSKFRKCRKERYLQHLKWSKLYHCSDKSSNEKDILDIIDGQSSEDEEQGTEGDIMDDDEHVRSRMDLDEDDARIDDVLQDLVNKQSSESKGLVGASKSAKSDPYRVYEFLQLTFEEAFFLSYGLGCLSITHSENKLSLSQMWSEFCRKNSKFLRNYVAYHYYRSKGWVPQVGLKYGTDLVLYKKGMPFFHSSYAVMTTLVDEKGKQLKSKEDISSGKEWTWKNLVSSNRLNEHVAKEVLICVITVPSDETEEMLENPNIASKCKVQELIVRRWIPKRERETLAAP